MPSPKDYADLEPEPEDILSVWGLESTQQNLEKVILPARYPPGKRGGTGLAWNAGGSLGLMEESKPFSTKAICWLPDIGCLVGQENVTHLVGLIVKLLKTLLLSPKTTTITHVSSFLKGGLEYIVNSSGCIINEGLKSCLYEVSTSKPPILGQNLNRTQVGKIPVSAFTLNLSKSFPLAVGDVVIGEGSFKGFSFVVKDVEVQSSQVEIGKEGIGFPPLSSQGFEHVGQLGMALRGRRREVNISFPAHLLGVNLVVDIQDGEELSSKFPTKIGQSSRSKRKKGKVIQKKLERPNLILGVDIQMNEVMEDSKLILVGQVKGR